MKYTIKKLKDSKISVSISIEEKDINHARKHAVEKIASEVKVSGFRAGKVPESVLVKQVGADAIQMETENIAISHAYMDFLKESKTLPLDKPEIKITKESPLEFTAEISVKPEIKLGDYRKVVVKKEDIKISKKEIDEVIEDLSKRAPDYKEVTRKAKKEDRLTIDFAGFDLEGNAVPNTSAQDHVIVIGSNTFIPGFEDELIGLKANEDKEFKIKFPENYQAKEMASKEFKFKVTVKKVEESKLSDINEDFVEKITGKKDTVESLRQEIEKNLLIKKERESRVKREEELLEKLLKASNKFEVPQVLVNEETEFILDNLRMQGLQQGLPWENYLKALNKTEEDLKREFKNKAETQVKYRLIIQEIIAVEKIDADDKEVEKRASAELMKHKPEHQKQMASSYAKGGKHFSQIKNMMQVEKVFSSFLS